MRFFVVVGVLTPYGWLNTTVSEHSTSQDACNWGFNHLPSKPTDPPWGVFDENGRSVPPPCTARTLDNLIRAWS